MNIFRVFFASILIPLISVGLCANGGSSSGQVRRTTVTVTIDKNDSIEDTDSNRSLGFRNFQEPRRNISLLSSSVPWQREFLPYQPHPLKLDTKSINFKNLTRIDYLGEGRVHSYDYEPSWFRLRFPFSTIPIVLTFIWRVISSYFLVVIGNILWARFVKKFGWAGPQWEFKTTLAKNEPVDSGWASSYGHHPQHQPLAIPYVPHPTPVMTKASQKAAKKAEKYMKRAQQLAAKASKYATKAYIYKQQIAPYKTGYLHPDEIYQGHGCVNCKFIKNDYSRSI